MKKRFFSAVLAALLLLWLFVPSALAIDDDQTIQADQPEAAFSAAIARAGVPDIQLEATAAILLDMGSGQVLYEQDADAQRYPASITKIMTALLTLEAIGREELSMDTVVTVPVEALMGLPKDSSTAGLRSGEEITVQDLLYCLLLPSANEAANILAITVAGDIPSFVERMNARAQELGMTGTHFCNANGLHDPDHYTTARDISIMAREAMDHAPFREIVSTGRYTVPATNLSEERKILNTNGLLAPYKFYGYTYSGTIGIKTGSSGEAGYCLASAVQRKGTTLLAVVLGCENPEKGSKVERKQFTESRRLYDWAFENFSRQTLLDGETYLTEVPVKNSFEGTRVVLRPTQSVEALVPGEWSEDKLELKLELTHETPSAPISAGDVLGQVHVWYDGMEYGSVDMAAVSGLSYSPFAAFVAGVNGFFGNRFVQIALIAAAVLIVVGLVRRATAAARAAKKERRRTRLEEKRRRAAARAARQDRAREQRERHGRPPQQRRPTGQQHRRTARDERRGTGPKRPPQQRRPRGRR